MLAKSTYIALLIVLFSCHQTPPAQTEKLPANPMLARMDSVRHLMQNVNAAYVIYIDSNGNVFEKHWGKNSSNDLICDTTIFEGASLSKTITAYIFWQMVKDSSIQSYSARLPHCGSGTSAVDVLRLLRHSIKTTEHCIKDSKADTFKYSEDNYLLLQKWMEQSSGKTLEQLAQQYVFVPLKMQHSTFIWNDSISDYVDGFYQDYNKHRNIYKFEKAASNGSLYTCAADIIRFSKALSQSDITDSITRHLQPVHRYKHLFWGLGMGIDSSLNHQLLWQWGCNWSYNHIVLIDQQKKDIIIGLSNSIIGAKRLRYTCNYLKNKELELFNYINWY